MHSNGSTGLGDDNPCLQCPSEDVDGVSRPRVTLATGAVNISACGCMAGLYLTPCPTCSLGNECATCPVGATCSEAGVELATLPIKRDYFRISTSSADVRKCLTNGVCVNTDGAQLCLKGRTGPYCEPCADNFYSDGAGCIPCGEPSYTLVVACGVLLFGLAVTLVLSGLHASGVPLPSCVTQCWARMAAAVGSSRIGGWLRRLRDAAVKCLKLLLPKLKILIALCARLPYREARSCL